MNQNHCAEYFVSSNNKYSQNELNNIVYLCLKYTFGHTIAEFSAPSNADIKFLMIELDDNQATQNIIDTLLTFVIEKVGEQRLHGRRYEYEHHMRYVINNFNSQSYELRNDLGEDSNSEDFITRH